MTKFAAHIITMNKLARLIDESEVCRRHHCYKVERYAILICRKLKLPSRDIKTIKIASILHDIGKIGIDLNIIRKPARLTPDEWLQVRRHPDIGANIIKQLGFMDEVINIIRNHHSRFEGGGYPDPGLAGEAIPMGSRIISVADSFDSMINDRPYRKAMSIEQAQAELRRCSGSQFDPYIVDVFMNI